MAWAIEVQMTPWWFGCAALAAPADAPSGDVDADGPSGDAPSGDASEEIVVWGDRLLRWERRWYVQTEVAFPSGLALFAERNLEVVLAAVQVRVVLSCDRDFPMGPLLEEVHCDIEDVGIIGLPRGHVTDADRVLAEIDATLTGANVQMQVTPAGAVPYLDLEGVPARNERTRERQEQMRQLMSRALLPFHLKLPGTVQSGATWRETASRLMSMPSGTGSIGNSVVSHRMDLLGDRFIVQSVGTGMLSPNGGVDYFDTWLDGVAVVDRDTGILSERVWAVRGEPTPSSPCAMSGATYHHIGRLRMLGAREHPDVGGTWAARFDDRGDPSAPAWTPLPP